MRPPIKVRVLGRFDERVFDSTRDATARGRTWWVKARGHQTASGGFVSVSPSIQGDLEGGYFWGEWRERRKEPSTTYLALYAPADPAAPAGLSGDLICFESQSPAVSQLQAGTFVGAVARVESGVLIVASTGLLGSGVRTHAAMLLLSTGAILHTDAGYVIKYRGGTFVVTKERPHEQVVEEARNDGDGSGGSVAADGTGSAGLPKRPQAGPTENKPASAHTGQES